MKAFEDDNLKVNQRLKFVLGTAENIVGIGENAGYQHFLLFPQCFQKASFLESYNIENCLSTTCGKETFNEELNIGVGRFIKGEGGGANVGAGVKRPGEAHQEAASRV